MEQNIAFLCADISRLFRKRFADAARSTARTGPQWRALVILERSPGITQGTLAEQMDVEPITACRMIDRLEQAGLVERKRDPSDRRAWRLFLTDAALPVVADLRATGKKTLKEVTSVLSPEEENTFIHLLGRVRDHLVALDEHSAIEEASNG